MFKWNVYTAAGKGRPVGQDFTRVANGITASLRDFHVSASRAQDEQAERQLFRRIPAPSTRAERSERVGREIQGLSIQAAMTPSVRRLDLSNSTSPSSPPPGKLITRVVTERSGRNYVPGTVGRGIDAQGRTSGGFGGARGRGGASSSQGAGRGGRGGRGVARARATGRRRLALPERPLTDGTGRTLADAPLKSILERARKRPVESENFEPFDGQSFRHQIEDEKINADVGALTAPRPVDRRDPNNLAERLLAGEVLRFFDAAEKGLVINVAKRMALARYNGEVEAAKRKGEPQRSPSEIGIGRQDISSRVRDMRDLRGKLVAGMYEINTQQQPALPALEGLERGLALNGTYKAGDEAALMRTVRKLLPVQRAGNSSMQPRR